MKTDLELDSEILATEAELKKLLEKLNGYIRPPASSDRETSSGANPEAIEALRNFQILKLKLKRLRSQKIMIKSD
jgi:hypothetical protein